MRYLVCSSNLLHSAGVLHGYIRVRIRMHKNSHFVMCVCAHNLYPTCPYVHACDAHWVFFFSCEHPCLARCVRASLLSARLRFGSHYIKLMPNLCVAAPGRTITWGYFLNLCEDVSISGLRAWMLSGSFRCATYYVYLGPRQYP